MQLRSLLYLHRACGPRPHQEVCGHLRALKVAAHGRAWKSSSVELDFETQTFMPRSCRRARTSAAGTPASEKATMPHSVRPWSCRRQPGTPAHTQRLKRRDAQPWVDAKTKELLQHRSEAALALLSCDGQASGCGACRSI